MQASNYRTSMEKAPIEFSRNDVLSLMWKNMQELDIEIHKKYAKATLISRQRDYKRQLLNGLGKTILYGLKDQELEMRIDQLEKTIGNAVVIPKERRK